jgi:predicted nucleic acid-binding Zn finger protein
LGNFLNELFVRFPNQEDYIIVYSFDSLEQLKMEKQYKDDQCDYINISISYPENRSKFESIVVESEDARKIIQKCKCYQMKIQELDSELVI